MTGCCLWSRMRREEQLLLLLCFITLTTSTPLTVDRWRCLTDFWSSLSCRLNITGPFEPTPYTLHFTGICSMRQTLFSCVLEWTENQSGCVLQIPNQCLSTENQLSIELHHNNTTLLLDNAFQPAQNIQTSAPHAPVLEQTSGLVNINWSSGYEEHVFLSDVLDFELLFQSSTHPPRCLSLQSPSVSLDGSTVHPGLLQCVQVRSRPSQDDYGSMWSQWSPQTCWKSQPQTEQADVLILVKCVGPLCALLLLLLCVYYIARVKLKRAAHVPSPAPFFQPLFQQYDGHLKEWFSAQRSYVVQLCTEKILDEMVIVEATPIRKQLELQDALVFPQTLSPYVGIAELECQTFCLSPETSYTQLPCSMSAAAPE